MRLTIPCVVLWCLAPRIAHPQSPACVVTGTVWDEQKNRVPYANVFFQDGGLEGQVTNERGEFRIAARTCGTRKLVAARLGYKTQELLLELIPGDSLKLDITLKEQPVSVPGLTVTGSSFSSKEEEGVIIRQMDVFTTPGAAADVFQAVKALPGLTQASESAELIVRGGNPYETLTLLDQATLTHPYHHESRYGGLFGSINPGELKDIFFSSGGFSARYGNALSGVMDIQTKDEAEKNALNVNLNLAGCAVNLASPIPAGKLALRFSGRKSFADLLFRLNRLKTDFVLIPTSEDATGSLTYRYSPSGKLRFSTLVGDDQQSMRVDLPSYAGEFSSHAQNALHNLQAADLFLGVLRSRTSLSYSRYSTGWRYGVWQTENRERVGKLRSDNELAYGRGNSFNFGAEINVRQLAFQGLFPADSTDFSGDAPQKRIENTHRDVLSGGYAENELQLSNRLFVNTGIRADHHDLTKTASFDYRLSCGLSVSSGDVIRLSQGTFHQYAQPEHFDPVYGNPRLAAGKAEHLVIGWERQASGLTSRIEVYDKKYSGLPLVHPTLNYVNQGYGYARGVDVMIKGRVSPALSGWIAYGFLDTRRKHLDFEDVRPTKFDITQNLTAVGTVDLGRFYELGLNYRLASGQPFTPITGGDYDSTRMVWKPRYGPTNSARMPTYSRLDVRLTKIFSLHPNLFSIFYLECLNVLGFRNIMDYTYAEDYTRRKEVSSFFSRRSIVLGVGMYF